MNRFIYTQTLRIISPIALWLLERKAKRAGGRWDIRSNERFGRYDANASFNATPGNYDEQESSSLNVFPCERPVWVHAVSLGETRAAQPLVQELLDQGHCVLLSHMTATGRDMGARIFSDAIANGRLSQAWFPYDFPEAAKGFLNHWNPRCGILIEREIWPNMVAEAKDLNIPLIVASARFSGSSLKQAYLIGSVLRDALLSLDSILAQSSEDAQRLLELGIKKVQVVGNLKFDVVLSPEQLHQGRQIKQLLKRKAVAITSTREGEEEGFIKAIKKVVQTANEVMPLFILVPRHPQRFKDVERELQQAGLKYVSRSALPSNEELKNVDVLFGDTIGELVFYYGMADVAIVAGSFEPLGGQNHIEASASGLPVIVGPHTRNFSQAASDAISEGAARRAENQEQAIELALKIVNNDHLQKSMGQAAKTWLSLHEGATTRIMNALQPFLNK